MLNFLNDPTGEMPWEEEEGSEDVRHIHNRRVSKLRVVLNVDERSVVGRPVQVINQLEHMKTWMSFY